MTEVMHFLWEIVFNAGTARFCTVRFWGFVYWGGGVCPNDFN